LIGAGENKGQVILYFVGGSGSGSYTPNVGELQEALIATFNVWSNVDLPATFPV
jgi:L-aminopeptidase/D-esterase-like protein